ncbi:DUF3144 domain-containing protein [Enterovibrio norvegicus]|uniref:DUF3144 domain-containing protein n=1 Tax=Enterovibrio norvegicus TaxID=188144 RepID=UPI000C847DBB|nr:DUF3144 domain-containing protein [Enterovibrio norvegicus]PML78719.1 hypothetical protein BCT69_04630 [Enterovibrio norvegicus]
MSNVDNEFYDRADAHIRLSNEHISEEISKGKASASMMYATSRFNAWVSATGWENGEEMHAAKEETIAYFVEQYKAMLEENLNDYIDNFNSYMTRKE